MVKNMVRRGSFCAAALVLATGSASAAMDGTGITVSIWNADTGTSYVNNLRVTGDFDGDNRFVARVDLNGVVLGQDAGGQDIVLDSSNFVEYEIVGSNLRAGGPFTANLNFNVQAGLANTGFSFAATPVAAGLGSAVGAASAGISITESSNPFSAPGATLSPNSAGIYEANYNGGSNIFADLFLAPLAVAPTAGSATFNDSFSGPIGIPVTDIGSAFSFTLSGFDLAAGTSTFVVTPAPGTLAMLGLGGLAAVRRRR